ncbi:hypothetical protein XAP412_180035 [Xanthomonas phaseoli pv. phaseoli]|uniref:Uncharacterized protein n=1 Tax=Xanthomonas campestris pv. phaseoli TaxID=317013 RepID=A0AB38DY56_XANCH|nr:hypothetical protein XAP6984_250098 [Xanthomonas phaseoli pv. phaseoli]SON80644.1 hypothetical protein XAP412_180035 [Xanthomonas phaseoli pv. phaseoli]SON85308.1 hypothetical protein XAP7430_200035 [Xanthomonas phaseoli pv. phaseoli]SOO31737.1 hypothetical protein XAP6164_590006 [Xanthomonas phaseoli pv. phaseoli]
MRCHRRGAHRHHWIRSESPALPGSDADNLRRARGIAAWTPAQGPAYAASGGPRAPSAAHRKTARALAWVTAGAGVGRNCSRHSNATMSTGSKRAAKTQ